MNSPFEVLDHVIFTNSKLSKLFYGFFCLLKVLFFSERCSVSWTISMLLNNSTIHWMHCTSVPHCLISFLSNLAWLRSIVHVFKHFHAAVFHKLQFLVTTQLLSSKMNSSKVVCITHALIQNINLCHVVASCKKHTEICLIDIPPLPVSYILITEFRSEIIFQWADSFQWTIYFTLNDLFMNQCDSVIRSVFTAHWRGWLCE